MSYSSGNGSVWSSAGDLTERQYILAYIGSMIYGLAVTALVGKFAADAGILQFFTAHLGQWGLLLWGLIVIIGAMFGALIAEGSDEPAVSLVGHTIMAAFLGLLVGPFTALFSADLVLTAIGLTAGVVLVLGAIGLVFPTLLNGVAIYMAGFLTVLVVGQFGLLGLAMMGVPLSKTVLNLTDWAGLVLFSGYVIYWAGDTMQQERTLDNAIDGSMRTNLAITNVFIRILSLLANSRD